MKHPMQPIIWVDDVTRFQGNKIVCYLLDNGGIDMNQIGRQQFDAEDAMQFAQLIGYSVSGFAELSYVSDEVVDAADEISEKLIEDRK